MEHRSVRGMRVGIVAALTLLSALWGQPARGETQVYKSTDAKGRVTYGDKPSPGAITVENLGVTAPDPAISAEAQEKLIDRLAETANRLRDDRLLREKALAETRPPPAATAPPSPAPDYAPESIGYPPLLLGYPGYNRYVHPRWDVPFNVDIHGRGEDFRHDASAGHHHRREAHAEDDDSDQFRESAEPRTPYREPSLLRNPRR